MTDLLTKILHVVSAKSYTPIKAEGAVQAAEPRAKSTTPSSARRSANWSASGRLAVGRNNTLRAVDPHGTLTGIFRRTQAGHGFVRPHAVDGVFKPEVFIREDKALDAATGDEVLVRVTREATTDQGRGRRDRPRPASGRRARSSAPTSSATARRFVRVDGTVFTHSISVGDPGAKGAKPQDKVVIEMLRFPTPDDRGEGVITEVLGPHGKPGVDTLSVIRAFGLPEEFPEEALAEARQVASQLRGGRPRTAARTSPTNWSSPSTRRTPATSTTRSA